jgi:alginate O-acetyltransferase complex protein AlgI
VWFLAIGFGLQLFFDFAGYSHIVIGCARIFGFRLEENFNVPFLASTPSEFWNRWHMSLSSWIRDYVFVPIAAARREIWWRYFALLFSMTLFGFWHGAKSTFVLWGMYQGALLVTHRLIQQARRSSRWRLADTANETSSWVVSFLVISLGWIMFRADSAYQAVTMLKAVLSPRSYISPALSFSYYVLVITILFAYLSYHKVCAPGFRKLLSTFTPEWKVGLGEWGLTREFAVFVSLIPMAAILFLGMLVASRGSETINTFVYAVF